MNAKILITLLLILLLGVPGLAQVCGGSIRHIPIAYPKGVTPAKTVEYELFYLMPKGKARIKYEEHAEFLSEFLYGRKDAKDSRFWITYQSTTEFLTVPDTKAEVYIRDYKPEDFASYARVYEHHEKQMKGSTNEGIIEFETRELDDTPFILRVRAEGFKTRYYLTDFLGGCFSGSRREKPFIEMQAKEPMRCGKGVVQKVSLALR